MRHGGFVEDVEMIRQLSADREVDRAAFIACRYAVRHGLAERAKHSVEDAKADDATGIGGGWWSRIDDRSFWCAYADRRHIAFSVRNLMTTDSGSR